MSFDNLLEQLKARGNFGHAGRPGKIGGSAPVGGAGGSTTRREGGWGKAGFVISDSTLGSLGSVKKQINKVGQHLTSNKSKIDPEKYKTLMAQGQQISKAVASPSALNSGPYSAGLSRINRKKLAADLNGLLDDIDEAITQ